MSMASAPVWVVGLHALPTATRRCPGFQGESSTLVESPPQGFYPGSDRARGGKAEESSQALGEFSQTESQQPAPNMLMSNVNGLPRLISSLGRIKFHGTQLPSHVERSLECCPWSRKGHSCGSCWHGPNASQLQQPLGGDPDPLGIASQDNLLPHLTALSPSVSPSPPQPPLSILFLKPLREGGMQVVCNFIVL